MYTPREWKNHIVQYLHRYRILPGESEETVYLIPSPGEIQQQGTPQNEENFNHMESGIFENSKAIDEHVNNTEVHIAEEERQGWNESLADLTRRLNALADSDDITLDQLSEIVSYIKNNKSLIDGVTTSKVNVSDIIDNLTSSATNKPLSAKQGKALNDLITALAATVENVDNTADKDKSVKYAASAGSATKATQDGDGNVFKDNYALKKIITSGSFNDIVTPGFYTMIGASNNTPENAVDNYSLLVLKSNSEKCVQQIAIKENSNKVYIRYYYYGRGEYWASWTRLLSEDDISELKNYNNLTNKPIIPTIQHGKEQVQTSANVVTEFSVSFDKDFPLIPNVIFTPRHASASNTIMFKLKTVTTSGFTGQIVSNNGGTYQIEWIAISD